MYTRIIILLSLLMTSEVVWAQSGVSVGRSEATGEASFAAGDTSEARGVASIAIGYRAQAFGDYSFAVGNNTYAGGLGSFAAGTFANTANNAEGAIAIGTSSAQAINSVAMGINNVTMPSAIGSAAFGAANTALGDASFVAGQHNTAHSFGSVVLGQFSEGYEGYTTSFSRVDTDRLFVIGNGFNNENRSNALVMNKNGDTQLDGNLRLNKWLKVGGDTLQTTFEEGQIRYNTIEQDLEGYTASGWHSLTGSSISVAERGSWVPKTNQSALNNDKAFADSPIKQFMWVVNSSGAVIEGESQEPSVQTEKGFDVLDFNWKVTNVVNIERLGTVGSSGKATLERAEILTVGALGSEAIALAVCTGEHIDELHVSIRKPDASDNLVEFQHYTFKDVIFESLEYFMDAENDRELNRIKVAYASIVVQNKKRNNNTGAFENDTEFKWNQLTNKAE